MDDNRFDGVARGMDAFATRRGTLAGLLAGLLLPALGIPPIAARPHRGSAVQAERRRKKRCQAGLLTCTIMKRRKKKKLCVDAQADPANCGACGVTCAPGQSCQGGRCAPVCTPPCPTCQACNAAGQCEAVPDRTRCGGSGQNASICCNGSCCSGCCGADGSCGACRAFVTGCGPESCSFGASYGDIGGLAGADALCQGAASEGVKPPGTYKAWLSDSSASPRTRFRCGAAACSQEGYVRLDGQVIATDWDDLTDGALALPITITQFGVPLDQALTDTWSHTAPDGSAIPGDLHCQDWTSTASGEKGAQGSALQNDARWTELENGAVCQAPRRLYCFQQD